MTRVLVTGALGNVGREVVRECARHGLTTRVADLDVSALHERFPAMANVRLDFLDRTTWASSLTDCDMVFLLRPPPIGNMERTLCPFVTAAYAAGVTHIVFLSVAGAARMKWVPHRKVELHLENTGTGWTVLRPGFFAQNLQDAYRRDIVEDDRIYVPAKRGRVAFVDVRDVAAVAAHVFQDPSAFRGQALTLTGPDALTFDDVARLLSSALERSITYVDASIPAYAWHLRRTRHMSLLQIAIQTILHVGLRRGDAENIEPTIERILGRKPRAISAYIRDSASTWKRAER